MSQDNNKLQNRVRIGGVDYNFSIDLEPVEGSGKPISSGAVAAIQQQLALFLGRGLGVVSTVEPHPKDDGVRILFNDYNLVLAEAVRCALDDLYDSAINKIALRVYNIEHEIKGTFTNITEGKKSYN